MNDVAAGIEDRAPGRTKREMRLASLHGAGGVFIVENKDVMAEMSRATVLREGIDRRERAELGGTVRGDVEHFAERFDPFHDPYLADPYPFFAEARATTPVFYSPDLDYWVVTRYHDIEQIFRTPPVFSAVNALAPLEPICPAAGRLLKNLAGSGGTGPGDRPRRD